MRLFNILALTIVGLFFHACSVGVTLSRTHAGHIYAGGTQDYPDSVYVKTDDESTPFEKECLNSFFQGDLELLRGVYAPQLARYMTTTETMRLNKILRERFEFNGTAEQLNIVPKYRTLVETFDNYDLYDFIRGEYKLPGLKGAIVRLFTTKVGGELKLCGFGIEPLSGEMIGGRKSVGILLPETIDKRGILKSPFTTYQKK